MKTVTKKELADMLECSPSSITLLHRNGVLKPLPDGRLDLAASLKAIATNTAGGSGWGGPGKLSLSERAQALLAGAGRQADDPHMADGIDRPSFVAGVAWLGERLRDQVRMDAMIGLLTHMRIPEAGKAVEACVYLVNCWASGVIAAELSTKSGKAYERELGQWVHHNDNRK